MNNKLKFAALLLCALTLLTACKNGDTSTPDVTSDTSETEAFTQVSYPDEPSPFSVNGTAISYDEYRYYMHAEMYVYSASDESEYWAGADQSLKDKVKADTLQTLRREYAITSLAKSYGVTLTEEQTEAIDESIKSVKDSYSESDYYKMLDAMNITEEVNRQIAERYYLQSNLYEYMTTEDSDMIINPQPSLVKRFIENYLVCADRIFIKNDFGDDLNANEALIKKIKSELDAGGDFNELKTKYSEDENVSENEKGVYFYKGDYDSYYYEHVLTMEEGQTSDIVTTPLGHMIVKRYAHDSEYIEKNLESEFYTAYSLHMFEFALQKEIDKQTLVYSDTYESVTVNTVK